MFRETVKGFINLSFALMLAFQSQADVQHISSRFIGYAKIFYGMHFTLILLGVLACCIAFYKLQSKNTFYLPESYGRIPFLAVGRRCNDCY